VGYNYNGSIDNSYSSGAVAGNSYVGGLVGYSYGSVDNSYSTGSATGSSFVGGLMGDGTGSVNNSFWDMDTSGQTISDGGTGLTTAQMQTASTFSTAGWDTTTIWTLANGAYPVLQGLPDPNAPSGGGSPDEILETLSLVDDITNNLLSDLEEDLNGRDDDDDDVFGDEDGLFQSIKLALVSEDGIESIIELDVPKGKVLSCQ
jgi:hypothetical protein